MCRMRPNRLPIILFGEHARGKKLRGDAKRRFKDKSKTSIDPETRETVTENQPSCPRPILGRRKSFLFSCQHEEELDVLLEESL